MQLEQLQRERIAAEASFEDSLQALKEQVTQVLNKYFMKDIDLQQAVGEMQEMGIEVVPVEDMSRYRCQENSPMPAHAVHLLSAMLGKQSA